MKLFKIKSLYMRIWITFTMAILVIIFLMSVLYTVVFRKLQIENIIRYVINTQDSIIAQINGNNFDTKYGLVYDHIGLESFLVRKENNKKTIINLDGDYDSDDIENLNSRIRDIANNAEIWMSDFAIDKSYKNKVFVKSHKFDGEDKDYIFVISNVTNLKNKEEYIVTYTEGSYTKDLTEILIMIGILFILISFFVAKFLARYITKSLNKLEIYAEKISKKEWIEPIPVTVDDEIGRLMKAMNNMRLELEKVDKDEKVFFQSISHDLKTPVMVIQSHAEALIDGMYIGSVEDTAKIIRKESIILEKKIKQILYLNTLDYMLENDKEIVDVDLEYILDEIHYKFRFINKEIVWNMNLEEGIKIFANEEKIVIAFENIVENALRYVNTRIDINLYKNKDKVVLEIFNDGENIKPEDLDKIFNNLYKGKNGSFGLGLHITKKIIDFYHGKIRVENETNGVRFFIEFIKN